MDSKGYHYSASFFTCCMIVSANSLSQNRAMFPFTMSISFWEDFEDSIFITSEMTSFCIRFLRPSNHFFSSSFGKYKLNSPSDSFIFSAPCVLVSALSYCKLLLLVRITAVTMMITTDRSIVNLRPLSMIMYPFIYRVNWDLQTPALSCVRKNRQVSVL